MGSPDYYGIPQDSLEWNVRQDYTTSFQWECQDGCELLLSPQEKGKVKPGSLSDF